jgi:hypothetical protein
VKKRTLQVITIIVLLLGFMRASGLVLGEPVAAYANQFDMLRTSACLGFWPVVDGDPKASTREAPVSHYRLGERDGGNCFPGAETLVAGAAIQVANLLGQDPVDLRWIGGFKLLLLLLVATAFQWGLRQHLRAGLTHAVIFTVVICDPFNLLFANSLYTEFSALLGAYMAIASVLIAVLLGQFRWLFVVIWLLGLVLLGGSRVQHLLLPMVMLIPAWWTWRNGRKGVWIASLAIAVMAMVMQFGLQHRYGKIDDANRINTLFYTVMPTHPEPEQFAIDLGIQQSCAELTNTSWYLRRGRDHRAECPGAFTISRLKLVAILATEPVTTTRLVFRALHQSGAWRLPYVGEVAGVEPKKLDGLRGKSIDGLVTMMPFAIYSLFYILPLWAGLWSGLWLLGNRDSANPGLRSLMLAQTLLTLTILVVAMTAIFGDGFSEFSRHVHLAHNACAVSWIIMPILLVLVFRQRMEPQWVRYKTVLIGALAGAVAMTILVPAGVPALALGFGVLDKPASEIRTGKSLELTGWAMDPNGIASVEAVAQGGQRWPLQHEPSAEVERFFPVGQPPVQFQGSIELDMRKPVEVIRIFVTSKSGQVSVIERRWMRAGN